MLESQLFGYRRGASRAQTARCRRYPRVEGGTLFLDEIADVPLDVQPKLFASSTLTRFTLSASRIRHGRRSGDRRDQTRTSISWSREGRFREDLLYRLNVVQLRMPPLRERRGEIPALVDHFTPRFSREQQKGHHASATRRSNTCSLRVARQHPSTRQRGESHDRYRRSEATLTPRISLPRSTRPGGRCRWAPPRRPDLTRRFDQSLPEAVDYLERPYGPGGARSVEGTRRRRRQAAGHLPEGTVSKRRRWGSKQAS